ncbi:MAG: D-sedoheptulose 7-phosphate isomerase [bacterium]
MIEKIKKQFQDNIELHQQVISDICPKIEEVAKIIIQAYEKGNKVLLCGNGGSAADAQHIAAELVGRFKRERRGLPAIALTTDTSIITAISNDYWYELLFSRQVEALGGEGDVLIGISTSGNSINIVRAVERANFQKMTTIAFLGGEGGRLKDMAKFPIIVSGKSSDRIQEVHILIAHIICDLIDEFFSAK